MSHIGKKDRDPLTSLSSSLDTFSSFKFRERAGAFITKQHGQGIVPPITNSSLPLLQSALNGGLISYSSFDWPQGLSR